MCACFVLFFGVLFFLGGGFPLAVWSAARNCNSVIKMHHAAAQSTPGLKQPSARTTLLQQAICFGSRASKSDQHGVHGDSESESPVPEPRKSFLCTHDVTLHVLDVRSGIDQTKRSSEPREVFANHRHGWS